MTNEPPMAIRVAHETSDDQPTITQEITSLMVREPGFEETPMNEQDIRKQCHLAAAYALTEHGGGQEITGVHVVAISSYLICAGQAGVELAASIGTAFEILKEALGD